MTELQIQFSSQLLSQAATLAAPDRYGIIDISPHTIRWMRSAVVSLTASAGDMEITAVSAQNIWQWREAALTDGMTIVTANGYLRALRTMYSRLQRNGTSGHNPASAIRPLPSPPPSPRAISKTDYRLLLNSTETARDTAIIDTLWATGCRAGELIGMNIGQLEQWRQNGRWAASVCVTGKGGRQRYVYWDGDAVASLQCWLAIRPPSRCPALFLTNRGRHFTGGGFSTTIRGIRAKAGKLKRTNPHAFRHAFAIRKLNAGYDLATVSQWLGHSSPEFTAKIYCIRSEAELRNRFFSPP